VAAFLVFIFVFFFQKISTDGIAEQVLNLHNDIHLMDDGTIPVAPHGSPADLQAYAVEKAKLLDARVTYIDTQGVVLADTEENPAYMENHSGRPEVKKALAGEDASVIRYSATLKKDMLYFAHPLRDNRGIIGVLRLSVAMASLDRLLAGLKWQYLLLIGFLVAVSIAAILIIYRYFKKEIDRFSAISRKVSDGDFDVLFSRNESYEIRELSKSFQNMLFKIKTLVADLRSEKDEIESIISSIDEGIVVVDGRGRILRANASFLKIFGVSSATGRYYWEVIRVNEVVDLLKGKTEPPKRIIEVEFDNRIFLCNVNRLPEKNEAVGIFYDVTGLKNWETMKKDLVTNVSHELGTPLTAIKGYVETLLDEEADERKARFLGIIARHTERLANIIKDLLMLSRLEEERGQAPTERVDLADVLANVLPLFQARLEEKGLALNVEAAPGLPAIAGDAFKLEQAFINLLDNAVKYTEKGGITVVFDHDDREVHVEIRDTGIGIPEKDVDRIFERFYVVDKSRSRAQGGTGLGLAIVKHIVGRHGGEIRVKSVLGSGTIFWLSFSTYAGDSTPDP
jgi:two-component system phosphate regulon sensor histidine kinase PhoR